LILHSFPCSPYGTTYITWYQAWKQGLDCQVFAALKNELAKGKAAWQKAQVDTETLASAVVELKKTTDQLTARVPSLGDHVKHLDNKVLDSITKLHARELYLEWTTAANDDLQHQVTQKTKKLESMHLFLLSSESYALTSTLLTLLPPYRN
jgi:uncharacterized coiled-coil protein SlyX